METKCSGFFILKSLFIPCLVNAWKNISLHFKTYWPVYIIWTVSHQSRLRTSGLEISETSVSHLVFVLIHSFMQNRWLGNCQILMLLIHECLPNRLLTVTENVLCFCCVNFVQPNCCVSVECVMWFRSFSVEHISLREWNKNKAFICVKHTTYISVSIKNW